MTAGTIAQLTVLAVIMLVLWMLEERTMSDRVCLFCTRFYIVDGEQGYSEFTPGDPPRYGCGAGHYKTDIQENGDYSEGGGCAPPLRSDMDRAATCEDYVYDKEWRTRS